MTGVQTCALPICDRLLLNPGSVGQPRDGDRVAATPGCAARVAAVELRGDVIAAISRVPARYQEQLTSAANDLVDRIPPCAQPEEKKHEPGHQGKHKRKKGHR